jgi:uncharacterized protein DUF2568
MVTTANNVLTIVLIVAAPLCVGWGGFALPRARVLAGVGGILVWAALWLLFGESWSPYPAHGFSRAVLEAVYFGSAAAALAGSGRKGSASLFSILYAINVAVRVFWS